MPPSSTPAAFIPPTSSRMRALLSPTQGPVAVSAMAGRARRNPVARSAVAGKNASFLIASYLATARLRGDRAGRRHRSFVREPPVNPSKYPVFQFPARVLGLSAMAKSLTGKAPGRGYLDGQ